MNFTKKGNDDEKEIYSDRTVGGNRHHRNISSTASAGFRQSQGLSIKNIMCRQSKAGDTSIHSIF